jgi:hypothetical protein
LSVKHMPRLFLAPLDFEPCSLKALQWTAENILCDGDQIILFSVIDSELISNSTAIDLGVIVPPLPMDPVILKKELDEVKKPHIDDTVSKD